MAPFLIRRADIADAPALAAIHVQSWRETYTGLLDPDFLARMTDESAQQRREKGWHLTLAQRVTIQAIRMN